MGDDSVDETKPKRLYLPLVDFITSSEFQGVPNQKGDSLLLSKAERGLPYLSF